MKINMKDHKNKKIRRNYMYLSNPSNMDRI